MAPLRTLLAHRQRLDPQGGPLRVALALGAAALGVGLGLELRHEAWAARLDTLYWLLLAVVAPQPLAAVSALYHDPLQLQALPWPLDGRDHFRLGTRLFLERQGPYLGLVLGAIAASSLDQPLPRVIALYTLGACTLVGALLAALGCAGLCAFLSESDAPALAAWRQAAAGAYSIPRHAPFYYLPAVSFAVVALTAGLGQSGALLAADRATVVAMALLGAPLAAGVLLYALGRTSYAATALRVIPRVAEHARSIYGGRPAPADPPYGASLQRLLPEALAPHFAKELRDQARGHRGLWGLVALAVLGTLLYAVHAGATTRAAPLVGLVLLAFCVSLPTRRGPWQCGASWLRTLPIGAAGALVGRWLALLFVAAHVLLPVGLTLWQRHGAELGVLVLALALSGTLAAATFTQPTRAASTLRWTAAARLVGPTIVGVGLFVLALLGQVGPR